MSTSRSNANLIGVLIISFVVAACAQGGGDDGGSTPPISAVPSSPHSDNSDPSPSSDTDSTEVSRKPNQEEASRFLIAASFGPNSESIEELVDEGYSNWVTSQILSESNPILPRTENSLNSAGEVDALRPIAYFYENAIIGEDQLRTRATFALSQIFVVSTQNSDGVKFDGLGLSRYVDILQDGAFGNFRDLLEEIVYSPVMADYLTYLGNRKANPVTGAAPDENFAREIMQLFTIGLYELDIDGTLKLDSAGDPIETYDNKDIKGLAKVFTGMWFDGYRFQHEKPSLSDPIRTSRLKIYPQYHSSDSKSFLGYTIPVATSGDDSVDQAIDVLFDHPNTAPFVSKQLIQRMTTSNPTPAYVERVANAFNSGSFVAPDGKAFGSGERGDLTAVWAAILLDPEFLDANKRDKRTFGKVREPVLRWTHWARMADVRSASTVDAHVIVDHRAIKHELSDRLGQRPFSAPSVFNFYRPGYIAAGSHTAEAGLTSPELQITDANSVVAYANFMRSFVFRDEGEIGFSELELRMIGDYSDEISLAEDSAALIDRLDLLLTAGTMSSSTRRHLERVINSVDVTGENRTQRLRDRVQLAVQLVVVSPEFIVQQ